MLAALAESYQENGQTREGMEMISEALRLVHTTGERFYEAELYRLTGELALQGSAHRFSSQIEEAEASFQKAIEIAQKQAAKSWELRAATSLARLWQSQGKTTEARDLLAPVYNWFTEGFDTADLKDAKALLNILT